MPGPCIRTSSGIIVDLNDPDANAIQLVDIAHALSNQCLFNGHTRHFYSVAQHSVLLSDLSLDRWWGLFYYAARAFVWYVPPTATAYLDDLEVMSKRITQAVGTRFRLRWQIPFEVHQSATNLDATAWKWLMKHGPDEDWPAENEEGPSCCGKVYPIPIEEWSPRVAYQRFLRQFDKLKRNSLIRTII